MSTVVIKIGSSSLVSLETGQIALANMSRLVEETMNLKRNGHQVVLVTSGSVGLGALRLGLTSSPKDLPTRQAAAATGQGKLIQMYGDLFSQFNQLTAQVLLTRNDIGDRDRYENGKSTLKTLLSLGVIPIVNENDTVSVSELRFGDNDSLSALVAGMVDAEWLFLLTDVDGLYTANPQKDPKAKRIAVIESLDEILETVEVSGSGSAIGTGGMETKIKAARLATTAGVHTGITLGTQPENISKMMNGEDIGSIFVALENVMEDHRWWIMNGLHSFGKIFLDDEACDAVLHDNPLSPEGILKVEGDFPSKVAVSLVSSSSGEEIARGLVDYASCEIERIKGKHAEEVEEILGHSESSEYLIDSSNLAVAQQLKGL